MADPEIDLDSVIDRLLEVRGSRPGKQVQLLEAEIRYLCQKAREIFISQPILLELEAPIKVHHFGRGSIVKNPVMSNVTDLQTDLRRYTRAILRSSTSIRIWWISSGSKLSFLGRLC